MGRRETREDGGVEHTEANLNGIHETQAKDAFERAENRSLVVANTRFSLGRAAGRVEPAQGNATSPKSVRSSAARRRSASGSAIRPRYTSSSRTRIADCSGRSSVTRIPAGDPPHTALAEVYEPPLDPDGTPVEGFSPRGMDVDREGVVWAAMASGHMGRFDRRRCAAR